MCRYEDFMVRLSRPVLFWYAVLLLICGYTSTKWLFRVLGFFVDLTFNSLQKTFNKILAAKYPDTRSLKTKIAFTLMAKNCVYITITFKYLEFCLFFGFCWQNITFSNFQHDKCACTRMQKCAVQCMMNYIYCLSAASPEINILFLVIPSKQLDALCYTAKIWLATHNNRRIH